MRQYSLCVKLGKQYRVVLLNSMGSLYFGGRLTATWGNDYNEGMLVNKSERQGLLQEYSIERKFSIADVDFASFNTLSSLTLPSTELLLNKRLSHLPLGFTADAQAP